MKNFFCFLLIVGLMFITACQNPLSGIDKVQTHIDNVETVKEQESAKVVKPKETDDNEDYTEEEDIEEPIPTEASDKQKDNKKNTNNGGSQEAVKEIITITAYYQDADGTLIPVTRNIKKEEGVAKAAIKSMIDSEVNREELKSLGLMPVLPKGTEVLGINIIDGTAVIDFNNKLLDYKDEQDEFNIFSGIVYTLTEFKTIEGVQVLVNGYEVEELEFSGLVPGVMTRENTLINSEKLNIDNKTMKLDVYLFKYIDDKHEYLLPVSMEYIGVTEDMLPAQIVRTLSKQPKNKDLYTQMPENVELLDSDAADKVLTLDFSREIKNYGGNSREEGLIKQILYTMKQIDGVEKVKILIEGKKDNLPEGTDISMALRLPEGINRVVE